MVVCKMILLLIVIFSSNISFAAELSSVSFENVNYDSDSSAHELGLYFDESMSFELLGSKQTSSSQLSLRGSSGLGITLEEIADRKKLTVPSFKKDTEHKDTMHVTSNREAVMVTSAYSCKRKNYHEIILDDNHKSTKKSHNQLDIMQQDVYKNHASYNSYSGYRK
ncbi:hypothetical protein [Candidatus Chromulinivorax destructor]|uniref:Uncharacterized protein n=1 Tax=Candidatus Chromulinivorax destructor TaxID=2066483 RepID=A0A345ZBE3_9BACT|nr:hypothetical protein [Candidatus Chromulinivorax destructor]AXK60610.1 hypothetical protein C0J27_02525 [Candidatus Chromulinivorax destructor]